MPVRLTPLADEAVPTKKVSPREFDPKREWFEISVFLRQETREAALAAARSTKAKDRRIVEEIDNETYFFHLFKAQLKGWRLLNEKNKPIPFDEENIRRLPWDLKSWLHDEILLCGGIIPTADLVIETESGQKLGYKSPDEGVGAGEA